MICAGRKAHERSPFGAVRGLWLFLLLSGCCCGSGLTDDGPTPYVHCTRMEPPAARDVTVGSAHVVVEGGTVRIETATPGIAVARGPAGCGEPIVPVLDLIEGTGAGVVILVGDLGDGGGATEEGLVALVDALGQLHLPVLLLPGAHDGAERVRDLVPGDGGLVDLMGVREVQIGALTLVPLPGAPDGRYAASDEACGFDESDVGALASGSGTRLLLAWAGPATGDARSAGLDGLEAGSPLVTRALEVTGAAHGLYAWPATAISVPFDGSARSTGGATVAALHLTLPRLLGPALEGDDGARAPSGVVVIEPAANGITVRELP